LADFLQPFPEGLSDLERGDFPAVGLFLRPGFSAGKVQHRRGTLQLFPPVGHLVFEENAIGEAAALPSREIGVLYRQGRQRRWLAAQKGFVERGDFAGDDGGGPAVGDDVVHGDEQDVLFVRRSVLSRQAQ